MIICTYVYHVTVFYMYVYIIYIYFICIKYMKYKMNIGNIKIFYSRLIAPQQFEWTLTLCSRMVMEDSCKLMAIPLNNKSFLGRLKREKGDISDLGQQDGNILLLLNHALTNGMLAESLDLYHNLSPLIPLYIKLKTPNI